MANLETAVRDDGSIERRVIIAIYLLAGFFAVKLSFQDMNPDGISYLSIARKYLAGDVADAVNGYWSPLISWLLVPLLRLGIDPYVAARIALVVSGLGAVSGCWWIGKNLRLSQPARIAVCACVAALALGFATADVTPDLLLASVLLLYIAHMTRPDYANSMRNAIVAGLMGTLAYLAKAYGLWFFLAHFILQHAMLAVRRVVAPGRALRLTAAGVASLAVSSAVWVSALSLKYGHFTTGSAASYNHALFGPGSSGHPHHVNGLIAPPDPRAVSGWDDPTYYQLPTWNPLQNRENLSYQVRLAFRNTRALIRELNQYSRAWPLILIAAVILYAMRGERERGVSTPILMAIILYPAGYVPIELLGRFLIPMVFLLLVVGAQLVEALPPRPRGSRLAVLFVLCASFFPLPIRVLSASRDRVREEYERNARIDFIPAGTRVASDVGWSDMLQIAFMHQLSYYGELRPGASPEEARSDIRRHEIAYFFVFRPREEPAMDADWEEISSGRTSGVRIYRLSAQRPASAQ